MTEFPAYKQLLDAYGSLIALCIARGFSSGEKLYAAVAGLDLIAKALEKKRYCPLVGCRRG